ncbi:hypothetical protein TNCV_3659141 [Trichonephila clavipes]|nr:hypothetical protein TNCV_3659141 [Trichonephila clavipes]
MFTIRTMHSSSSSEMQQKVILTGIVRSFCNIDLNTANTDGRRIDGHVQINLKKKFKELRSGKHGGQATSPHRLIHLLEYVTWKGLLTGIEKCDDTQLCMNHTFWCAAADTPCDDSGRSGKFAYVPVFSIRPRRSKSLHSFGHSPRRLPYV